MPSKNITSGRARHRSLLRPGVQQLGKGAGSKGKDRTALDLAPDFAHAWFLWSKYLKKRGQLDKAAEKYRKAHELDPLRYGDSGW